LVGSRARPTSALFLRRRSATDVMVHVGFAISKVDAEEAARTYQALETMGLLEAELGLPTDLQTRPGAELP
jgi:hydrogenase expression/formation protein HypC